MWPIPLSPILIRRRRGRPPLARTLPASRQRGLRVRAQTRLLPLRRLLTRLMPPLAAVRRAPRLPLPPARARRARPPPRRPGRIGLSALAPAPYSSRGACAPLSRVPSHPPLLCQHLIPPINRPGRPFGLLPLHTPSLSSIGTHTPSMAPPSPRLRWGVAPSPSATPFALLAWITLPASLPSLRRGLCGRRPLTLPPPLVVGGMPSRPILPDTEGC